MLNLERSEKIIIIFLLFILILGILVAAYRKSHPGIDIRVRQFILSEKDKDYEAQGFRININEASAGELMKLKGVGRSLAERITEYRSREGNFISVDDIKKVKGIGDSLFEKIKDDITIE